MPPEVIVVVAGSESRAEGSILEVVVFDEAHLVYEIAGIDVGRISGEPQFWSPPGAAGLWHTISNM